MFFNIQAQDSKEKYIVLLQKIGSLSKLFSDSSVPYLYYRVAENVFCRVFDAKNHSRSDTSADASKDKLGIGLKTYIGKTGSSYQKIAEFNKKRSDYSELKFNPEKIAEVVSSLRNKRIDFAKSAHGLDNIIYHCVTRTQNKFQIFEEHMEYINVDLINVKKSSNNAIHFTDGTHDYNFNLSKSTLFKRFVTVNPFEFDVNVLQDPFKFLESFDESTQLQPHLSNNQSVILPLYSKKKGEKLVHKHSGLNAWNAGGRIRHMREVYILIPSWIHRVFPDFFPARENSFNLKLPNGKVLKASVSQDGGKALSSNPNKDLGEWLIDKVLKIESNDIVVYKNLEDVGIDSVEVTKIDDENFEINFKQVGSFETFEDYNLIEV